MDFLNTIIDNYNIPLLSAFLLGIITSISPCPLATNITAISYISKNLASTKQTLLHSALYTLGRIVTYTVIIFLIWGGLSAFHVASLFQGYGDKLLGPILIIIGLVMLGVIRFPSLGRGDSMQKFKESLYKKGYLGTFLLGVLFALAFCPYSGVMFFGILIPLVMSSLFPLGIGILYGIGTALPVLFFSILFVISIQKMSKLFKQVGVIEKYMRYMIATVFVLVGMYYSYISLQWFILLII